MICDFIDCCVGDDYWVECKNCGSKLITMAPARKFNELAIVCEGKKELPKDIPHKSITFVAQIIELGDNLFSRIPQIYLMQDTGNRILLDVNRPFLIDLIRGDGDKFSVYDCVNLTISISKK